MANFCSTTFITSMQCSHIYVFINGAKRVLMESYYNITGQNTVFYWNKKCFLPEKNYMILFSIYWKKCNFLPDGLFIAINYKIGIVFTCLFTKNHRLKHQRDMVSSHFLDRQLHNKGKLYKHKHARKGLLCTYYVAICVRTVRFLCTYCTIIWITFVHICLLSYWGRVLSSQFYHRTVTWNNIAFLRDEF